MKSGTQPFIYTGSVQEFIVPPGVKELKLEVWGASGGTGGSGYYPGGKGGYSYGILKAIPKERKLYVYVGEGGKANNIADATSTFNGGGPGIKNDNASGGGATDVRTNRGNGNWNDIVSIGTRLIVAGGGGGGSKGADVNGAEHGGNGGGGSNNGEGAGSDKKVTPGAGGGENGCANSLVTNPSVSSGGGYYNGCSCSTPNAGGGGGGSGYIGGVTNGGGENGKRSGNGIARICWGDKIDVCGNNNQQFE